jgi:FG-GAP repeat
MMSVSEWMMVVRVRAVGTVTCALLVWGFGALAAPSGSLGQNASRTVKVGGSGPVANPFVVVAKLSGAGERGSGQFGISVALSADGDTALVGAAGDDNDAGAVWVFTRSGRTWRQQGPKLTVSDQSGGAGFGSSVAVSADGNVALIGGPSDQVFGSAWVFTRSGITWSESAKFTASGAGAVGDFGSSVSLSSDGGTALVGAQEGNLAAGGAVFVHSSSGWVQQATLTAPSGGSGASIEGFGTTLSGDGNTALVGGNVNNLSGGAWVFTRSGSTWSRQAGTLTPSNESGPAQFGLSGMALSADGSTAVIGGAEDNGGAGAAWTFTRSGSTWRHGPKLTAAPTGGSFGESIALSDAGDTALIGAPTTLRGSTPAVGAAWVFSRSGRRWLLQGSRLTGGAAEGLGFGASTALSPTGTIGLIGATSQEVASTGRGAAWIFAKAPITRISRARIRPAAGSAVFSFKAVGSHTGFQCALIKSAAHRRRPRPSFSRCRSPRAYRHLGSGHYTFLARAVDRSSFTGNPASRSFGIG